MFFSIIKFESICIPEFVDLHTFDFATGNADYEYYLKMNWSMIDSVSSLETVVILNSMMVAKFWKKKKKKKNV